MDKLDHVKYLLDQIGMPPAQQSTLCCLTLLAMSDVKKDGSFKDATNEWIRIHDVISFIDKEYGVVYAENSRETFRKQQCTIFVLPLLSRTMGNQQIVLTIAIE